MDIFQLTYKKRFCESRIFLIIRINVFDLADFCYVK